MKKLLTCLLAIVAVSTLSAQQKGEMYFGGSIGVVTSTSIASETSATGFGLSLEPEFGGFVADKFCIGFSVGYGLETANRTFAALHALGVMPKMAYYVRLADNFYYTPTLQFGFVCGLTKEMSGCIVETITMPGFGVGLSLAGFEFRPTPKFGITLSLLELNYTYLNYKENDYATYQNSSIDFRFGGSSTIGLRCYF